MFNLAPRHDDILGMVVQNHAFVTLTLGGGEWSASAPEIVPPLLIGEDTEGPLCRSGHDGEEEKTFPVPRIKLQSFSRSLVTILTELPAPQQSSLRKLRAQTCLVFLC